MKKIICLLIVFTMLTGVLFTTNLVPQMAYAADELAQPSGDVLRFDATTITGKTFYWKIGNASYTFKSGDYIEYDVYLTDNVNGGLGGIEVYTSLGTLRTTASSYKDQNGISALPGTDLRGKAEGKWYHRKIAVPADRIGGVTSDFCVGIDMAGYSIVNGTTYTAIYDNIVVTNNGANQLTVYGNGAPQYNVNKSPYGDPPSFAGNAFKVPATDFPSGDALRFDATSYGSSQFFWKIGVPSPTYTFQSGDCIEYDVLLTGNTNGGLGGIEVYTSAGTFRTTSSTYKDQNGISAFPDSDLRSKASDKWYHRKISVPADRIGSTIVDFDLGISMSSYGGAVNGTTYTALYDNIVITNNGSTQLVIYRDGNPQYNVNKSPYGDPAAFAGNAYKVLAADPSLSPEATPTPTSIPTSTPTPKPTSTPTPTPALDTGIVGKTITGYQGWFDFPGSGSPLNRWKHWAAGTVPAPGNQLFEMYPDISEYNPTSLAQTGYSNFGDGREAKLFSSYPSDVVNLHFSWMKTYGIDGAAIQRFGSELSSSASKQLRDAIASKARTAAEANDLIFYIMYDTSGMKDADFDTKIKEDWINTISGSSSSLNLTASKAYAKQNGKYVVNLWGMGFGDRPGTSAQCIALINWFKSQGCYVIGGIPNGWRTSTGNVKANFFADGVYKQFNMISPWSVSAYTTDAQVDSYKNNNLIPDKQYCDANGMEYQPVVWTGFAWSNWNGGVPNSKPRRQGGLFWRQAYNIKSSNISNMYIAMFDEYDEATAIMKAAEDSSMIPTDQYFLTLSADGTYMSSDFYLRLAGAANRMIKGIDPLTPTVPIPYSLGPVFFRTSVEPGLDATQTWVNTIDGSLSANVLGYNGSGEPVCDTGTYVAHRRSNSIKIEGYDNSTSSSYAYFKAFDVDIPVTSDTKLSFWTYPENSLGRFVTVDLVMTDGTALRQTGAVDYNNISMSPGAAKGTVGTWTQIKCDIGNWLNGKTIDKILIDYSRAADTGNFRTYIDDIVITNGTLGY